MVDMIFNGTTTVAVTNYDVGSFDCRPSQGMVPLTLTPVTDGKQGIGSCQSMVYGSFGGLTLLMDGLGSTPATDGSETALTYWDASDDDSGAYTGYTSLKINSKAKVTINQLHGGNLVPWSTAQAYLAAHPRPSPGQVVQDVGGTWVTLGPTVFPEAVFIEADINALTFVDTNHQLFLHGMTVIVDTGGTYVIEDAALGVASGAMVRPATGVNQTGLFIRDINAAALKPRATFDGTYLTLK